MIVAVFCSRVERAAVEAALDSLCQDHDLEPSTFHALRLGDRFTDGARAWASSLGVPVEEHVVEEMGGEGVRWAWRDEETGEIDRTAGSRRDAFLIEGDEDHPPADLVLAVWDGSNRAVKGALKHAKGQRVVYHQVKVRKAAEPYRKAYEPREHGALCDECMFSTCPKPVPPERNGASVTIVADFATDADSRGGAPQLGRGGQVTERSLARVRRERLDVNWSLAVACPPRGSWQQTLYELRRLNRQRAAQGEPLLLHPVQACRPRLLRELEGVPNLIVQGKLARAAVLGEDGKVANGTILELDDHKVVQTVAPSLVASRRRWQRAFDRAIERAFGFFEGTLEWETPTIWLHPVVFEAERRNPETRAETRPYDIATIRQYLASLEAQGAATYDTETGTLEPLNAWRSLRTVQFSPLDGSSALVVAFSSKDPTRRDGLGGFLRTGSEQSEVRALVWHALCRAGIRFFGHNAASYDRMVMEGCFEAWYRSDAGFRAAVDQHPPPRLEVHAADRAEYLRLAGVFTPTVHLDTMVLKHTIDAETPKSLGYCGAFFSDVHDWKGDNAGFGDDEGEDAVNAWSADSDAVLHVYGGLDTVVNARIIPAMAKELQRQQDEAQERARTLAANPRPELQAQGEELLEALAGGDYGPLAVLRDGMAKMDVCTHLHRHGLLVDQEVRAELEAQQIEKGIRARGLLEEALRLDGMSEDAIRAYNPHSPDHVARLLFERWELTPPANLLEPLDDITSAADWATMGQRAGVFTATGRRSTGDTILRAYLVEGGLTEAQEQYINAHRWVKQAAKLISDKLRSLKRLPDECYGPDGYPTLYKTPSSKWPVTAVWADGRARTGWNALGTTPGRLSSSSPMNLQNIKKHLRRCFVPAPGHVFVGADWSALHLRIIANLWKIPSLVDAFERGYDTHVGMAILAFGQAFWDAAPDGWTQELGKKGLGELCLAMRQIGKTLRYSGAYRAAPVPTIYAVMTKAEDEFGYLSNRDITPHEVEVLYETWMENEPEWRLAWAEEDAEYERWGLLADPLLGRECRFADGYEPSKIVNYRVLAMEAALASRALIEIHQKVPPQSWSPHTGVCFICHDAIAVEVPEERALEAARIVHEAMNVRVPGHPIVYEADGNDNRTKDGKPTPADIAYNLEKVA